MIIEDLKNHFDAQTYDKKYQDIECLGMIGYTESHKTWNNIKNLIDWKGKKVADIGCFHGYFAFKAAKLGAIVTGLDISETVLKTTKYINEIEGNIITLKKWEGGDEISSDYDVTLCLNVLHHFTDKKKAIENIKSKIVIFETNINLFDIISEKFNVIKRVKSHRSDNSGMTRIILLCERKLN
jgi:2-polyprenyl-3-methyl-5-hydroxy-6-metoxy-1,4-benzoquinol methylase